MVEFPVVAEGLPASPTVVVGDAGNVLLFSHAIRLASCIGMTLDARDVDVDDGSRHIQVVRYSSPGLGMNCP